MSDDFFKFKAKVHERLLEMIDLSLIETMAEDALILEITQLAEQVLKEESNDLPLNRAERKIILTEIIDEIMGLGPLEPFLKDPHNF